MNNRIVGSVHEAFVCSYIKNRGMQVLERNYRSRQGEIDIIAKDGRYFVFIEVKYRRNKQKGFPLEAVGYAKQKRISQTAYYYLYSHGLSMDTTPVRFDVAGILGSELTYIQDAFNYV